MFFATAGIEVSPLIPVAAAFGISLCCSMGGISGAFFLLPFQISVLGYTTPGVSATNHIFNVLACPAGVWRYYREGRLLLPLALFIALGTLPGVFLGAILRVTWLASLKKFMLFVAIVLIYLGFRMIFQGTKGKNTPPVNNQCIILEKSWRGFSFTFDDNTYKVKSVPLMALSFVVGLIGGVYGIGGGAIMVPFLVAYFGLPVYAIAGASLFATFLTSIAGVAFFSLLSSLWSYSWAAPDWILGALFGLGGIFGMYCGAALQRYVAPKILRWAIIFLVLTLGCNYLFRSMAP